MNDLGTLFNLLAASDAMIEQSAIRIPGYEAPLPFRIELTTLRHKQRLLRQRLLEIQRGRQRPGNLGIPIPLVVGGGAALVLGLSAVGGWIYSHFTDAKALDAQTEVYQNIRAEGTDSRTAAEIVFGGGGTDWVAVINKLILLSVVGAGVFLLVKLVK